jgi:hypothetical protein
MTRRARTDEAPMLPYWTAMRQSAGTEGGIWPLGLEQVGLRIEDDMLPGLTNQTAHVRYYSMFAWAFWKFAALTRASGREIDSDEQFAWFRRVENAFRVASELAEPKGRGLVGSRAIRNQWDRIDRRGARVSLVDDTPASAWAPYGASFREMRCARLTGQPTPDVVQLLHPVGTALAKAFDSQLRATADGRRLIAVLTSNADSVPVDLLRNVGDEFTLRQVEPGEPEHLPLLEMLAPHAQREDSAPDLVLARQRDRARSRTIGMFLDLAKQSAGAIADVGDLYRVFAGGALRNGSAYRPPGVFMNEFLRWRRYQERQHQKLALYGIWREILELLRSRRRGWASATDIIDHLRAKAATSPTLIEWCGRNPLAVTVKTAAARVAKRVRDWPDSATTAPFVLARKLIGSTPAEGDSACGVAIVTAIAAVAQWELRRDTEVMPETIQAIHRWGGRQRIALTIFAADVRERDSLTLDGLLTWMAETCVIGQSLHVAVEKWVDQRQDRFFIAPEGNGYALTLEQDFRRLGYDGGRVSSAFRLIEGLGLVTDTNGVRITTTGKQALSAIRQHHEGLARDDELTLAHSAA